MSMNRRAAVASKLLKQAGYTGDLTRLAESLPPETLVQFDKLLNHKEPSVGPGMDSGIVVAYKSGEVVQDRPMQGNFSKEGIAVYEGGGVVSSDGIMSFADGGAVWDDGRFGVGDLWAKIREDGLPANARAYLSSVVSRATGGEPPVFGADYFTDPQLERIREMAAARQEEGFTDVKNFEYPDTPSREETKLFRGEAGSPWNSLMYKLYNSDRILSTSLGGFQIYDEGDRWRIEDPFDFMGTTAKDAEELLDRATDWGGSSGVYSAIRDVAPTVIASEKLAGEEPEDWVPRFSFTIPKEGPVRGEAAEPEPMVEGYADGGAVEPRSADSEAEILAIYDLLDEENQKPERERDPERIDELYSRLTELQAMSPPPVALELSDDVYIRPQLDARFGIGESNRRVPFFEDTVTIRDRNMGGIGRLGAEIGFPGFSGNDRISGGVTATYDRTKRLLPDEFIAFGAPSDIRFGPRGVVPRNYDVSYSSGPHTFSGNVTPRQEGVSRDAPGGRSVLGLGYARSTPKATYSFQATPFGRRVVTDPKTGDTEMERRVRAGVTIPF